MFKSHRYLTAAVLVICSCLLTPFYAHAEEPIRVIEDSEKRITVTTPITEESASGTGLLVKGSKNNITIDADITASGASSTGLLVESGYENNITLNAGKTIQALGDDGIAVSFIGNREVAATNAGDYISGPCVNRFIVDGSLAGKQASISIDPSTHVRDIYIQNGSSLQGDIIADKQALNYDTTMLTFGNYGVGDQDKVDGNLKISYSGDIHGEKSISMKIVGTNLEYTGEANVSSVTIAQNATLSGAGTYVLGTYMLEDKTYRNSFINSGTLNLSDGNANTEVNITGDYTQSGKLLVDFDTNGESDKLIITDGSATLNGYLTLTPQVDYYYNGQKITIDIVDGAITSNTINGQQVIFNNISPVLEFSLNTTDTSDELVSQGQYVIDVKRKEQGYQSVATDDITSGIGQAIDIDTQKQNENLQLTISVDKQALLKTLDNPIVPSNLTGEDATAYAKKEINSNLKKLNPNVVSSQAQAVIETHTTLNNLVSVTSSLNTGSMSMNTPVSRRVGGLGPTRVEPPKYNSWRNIVIPFAGYTDQHNGSNGYTNHNSGVIGAIERTFANGLTHGYHAALNHQSTSDSGSTVKGEGLYFGAHASYAPADWNGWSLFGSARLGVEQMRSHRNVAILGTGGLYTGRVDSDWTGFSGSLNLGTALTKEHGVMQSGPFAALDYSFVHRPSTTETGAAYRAYLEGATYDSLRTQLGYRLVTKPKALDSYDSTQWQAHASVAWNHELLNDNGSTNYQMVEFPGSTIEDNVELYGRDSMSIAAGVIFKTPNRLDVGLTLGSDIYRKGGSSIYGKVNFEWKF